MTVILAFLVGNAAGVFAGVQVQRRVRAERNLARLQRDLAEQDRDQALRGAVVAFDPKMRAMRQHPAGKAFIPGQANK